MLLKDTESQNHSGGKTPGAGGLSSYLLPRAGWDTNSDQLLGLYLVVSWKLPRGGYLHGVLGFFSLIATLNLLFFQFKATTSCFPTTHHCEGPGSISLLACLWVLGLLCASAAISSPGWTSTAPSSAPRGIKLLMEIPVLARNHSVFALLGGYFSYPCSFNHERSDRQHLTTFWLLHG